MSIFRQVPKSHVEEKVWVPVTDAELAAFGDRYTPGADGIFGNHGVCLECGAMIDFPHLQKHTAFHEGLRRS